MTPSLPTFPTSASSELCRFISMARRASTQMQDAMLTPPSLSPATPTALLPVSFMDRLRRRSTFASPCGPVELA